MGYSIRALDITEFKCDAIFNSLGVRKSVNSYGAICRSIVSAAGFELKKDIASYEDKANPGRIFISSGYNLPAKHVIHVVTPYFSKDPQLIALEYVYKLALTTAKKKNFRKIALPIIGTGANGYPRAFVIKMVHKLVKAFVELYPTMNVTICMPLTNVKEYEEKFDENELRASIEKYFKKNESLNIREFEYDETSFKKMDSHPIDFLLDYSDSELLEVEYSAKKGIYSSPKKQFLNEMDVLLEIGNRNIKLDYEKYNIDSIGLYISYYLKQRYEKEDTIKVVERHVYEIVGGVENKTSLKSKHEDANRRSNVTTSMLMRYILALHMTMEEANDLLLFCGKAFSPVSKEDTTYKILIEMKKYDIYQVNDLCDKKQIKRIFNYDKTKNTAS